MLKLNSKLLYIYIRNSNSRGSICQFIYLFINLFIFGVFSNESILFIYLGPTLVYQRGQETILYSLTPTFLDLSFEVAVRDT